MSSDESSGLLLHLAAPLQSWGTHSYFNSRDTHHVPTRSGMIGLIGAGMGRGREEAFDDLATLRFIVRVDRPGKRLRDYHTVGGGLPRESTVATAEGKRRPSGGNTLTSERYYLADAAFTVAAISDDPELLAQCQRAVSQPKWPLFLGRRSCPPTGPVDLGIRQDPHGTLARLPLARQRGFGDTVTVDYYADHATVNASQSISEVGDEPESFLPRDRRYRHRPVFHWRQHAPVTQCGGYGIEFITMMDTHLHGVRP